MASLHCPISPSSAGRVKMSDGTVNAAQQVPASNAITTTASFLFFPSTAHISPLYASSHSRLPQLQMPATQESDQHAVPIVSTI